MKKITLLLLGIAGIGLVVGIAKAATYQSDPGACGATTWLNCSNAFLSDDVWAEGVAPATGIWKNYDFGLPASFSTPTVEVGVEAHQKKVGARCTTINMNIAVSRNGGQSFGPNHQLSFNCSDTLTWVDVTSDFGSGSWTFSQLSSNSFQVRADCVLGGTCELDWLPVRVTI